MMMVFFTALKMIIIQRFITMIRNHPYYMVLRL